MNKWLFVLKSLYLKQQRLRQQAEREKFVFLFTCLISNWPIPEREHKVFKYILKTKINSANSLSIACMVSSLFFCFFFFLWTQLFWSFAALQSLSVVDQHDQLLPTWPPASYCVLMAPFWFQLLSLLLHHLLLSNACLFLWVANIFTKRRLPLPFLLSYAPASIVLKLNSPILKRVQSIKFVSVFTWNA